MVERALPAGLRQQHVVCPLGVLRRRRLVGTTIGSREIIVAWVQGRVVAYEGVCLHLGGPLAKGCLTGASTM